MNGLFVENIPESLQLTDVENQLIAINLLFMKLKKLPKSRMGCMADRVVNVSLTDEQIMASVKTLPRSLDNGFIVPIQFKRMKEMKNSVMEAFVRPNILIDSLKTLKLLGNPHYQTIEIDFEYYNKNQEVPHDKLDADNESFESDDSHSDKEKENSIDKFQNKGISEITCLVPKNSRN